MSSEVESAELRILQVDGWLVIVEKPAGLLSVPGRLPEHQDCVAKRLQYLYPDARTVHRLDQVTSGLMVFARDGDTHRALSEAFARREVDKEYIALVQGSLEVETGEVTLPLICDWPNRPRQIVDHASGKPALTRWRVLTRDPDSTRVVLVPHTGRSHQLRVHMASLGHAIVGDTFYGGAEAPRVMLHASRLGFVHPATGEVVEATSPAPF